MRHECNITVLETKVFPELQEQYLADPKSGPCPFFKPGDTFTLKRTPQQDDFYHLMNGNFCGEAWDAISRYVYTALQGGSIMHRWTNDERMMIACCNDGTRPVIFKIERVDIPETPEEEAWLAAQHCLTAKQRFGPLVYPVMNRSKAAVSRETSTRTAGNALLAFFFLALLPALI
ncbi:MAG: TIGR04076 family protein [Clostridia bacterium]|nr:TIGR04076 family protein [Clostridia bacterium]